MILGMLKGKNLDNKFKTKEKKIKAKKLLKNGIRDLASRF